MKQEIQSTRAHRLLAPRPVCLLTTRYKGQVNVMTIGWVCPISLDPPLVVMAVHPMHYTHDMLTRSEECVVNIPGRRLGEQVIECGTKSGKDTDKLADTGLHLESGHRVDAPWIEECLAHLECAIVDRVRPGDHTLFIAQVVGAWVEEEAFDQVWLAPEDNEELTPLCHLGGSSFCLVGNKLTLPPDGED